MRLVADLHIHSRYSLATSSKLTLPYLDRWARIKGIGLLGTGDCTHPAWLAELREQLEPDEGGFFRLKAALRHEFDAGAGLSEALPSPTSDNPVRFVLTGEISTIYSRDGKTRKVHHVVILPDFTAAAAFQARLARMGNISSDGRPILGVDSRDLFAVLLDADERSILVPAHIWTPWFSALGARSGFDSIEECYGDLAPHIGAIETGLSSNPPMNWAVSSLDRFAVISNSDAHSPEKLGREATVIDMENSFAGLAQALSGGGPAGKIAETVEFFPQEGKYHYDGHRACGVVLSPRESADRGGLCPVCGKPLTPGVLHRVAELADRPIDETAPCPQAYEGTNRRPYKSLIPLPELLAEIFGTAAGSKKVAAAYGALVERVGSEFALLLHKSEREIEALKIHGLSGELLAMAVGRMRSGQVSIEPGYDGEYGVIHAFAPGERIELKKGASLFEDDVDAPQEDRGTEVASDASSPIPQKPTESSTTTAARTEAQTAFSLDPAQHAAVHHGAGPALVVAGPGTGKTAVLALRISHLVDQGLEPSSILAITFTNKAAGELRERIAAAIGEEKATRLTAATFHSFCLSLLREYAAEAALPSDFTVLDEEERTAFLRRVADAGQASGGTTPSPSSRKVQRLASYIEGRKRFLLLPGDRSLRLGAAAPAGLPELAAELGLAPIDADMDAAYARYRDELKRARALDFDDLVAGAVRLLAARPAVLSACRSRFRAIFVDEYQDVNFAQYALIRLLAPDAGTDSTDLCVIGDPNQAIYGFRGADWRFIDRFLVDYPGASVYRLVRSFRCATGIIGAAGRLVRSDLGGSGSEVALLRTEFPTEASEAEGIAREIDRLIGGTRFFAIDSGVAGPAGSVPALSSLGECAILIRASALAAPIEKALLDHGIPYRFVGEKPWWEETPVRPVLNFLRTALRPDVRPSPELREADAPEDGRKKALRAQLSSLSPTDAVRAAIDLMDVNEDGHGVETASRKAPPTQLPSPLERLVSQSSLYPDLMSFLDDLALGSPQDGYETRRECVSLLTIHAAKGLEFDYVFVAGLEEGLLPFTLFEEGALRQERIDEERRLLYVAMTRARIGLYLSWARSRRFLGRALNLPPSRFLAQIEDLVPIAEHSLPQKPKNPQLELF